MDSVENHGRNASIQVCNVTPLTKEKMREAVPRPYGVYTILPTPNAQAKLEAALEERIVTAAKEASLETQANVVPHVDSWL